MNRQSFLATVILANIIALPLVFFTMNGWLDQFAYHVEIGYTSFIASALLTLIIAAATVALQSIRAATDNPVTNLRSE